MRTWGRAYPSSPAVRPLSWQSLAAISRSCSLGRAFRSLLSFLLAKGSCGVADPRLHMALPLSPPTQKDLVETAVLTHSCHVIILETEAGA